VDYHSLGWVTLVLVLAVVWLVKVWCSPDDKDDPL
jgi:hypothetical protein